MKKNPTLLLSFDDQPNWCRQCFKIDKQGDYELGQLVLDHNKTLAQIVLIAPALNLIRLSLIDNNGKRFAEVTSSISYIKQYNYEK